MAALRPTLWTVSAAAALVLTIASPVRLFRLLAVEGFLLGIAATAVGVLASRAAMRAITPLVERVLERRVPGGLDAFDPGWPALIAIVTTALAVTLLFTNAPSRSRRPGRRCGLGEPQPSRAFVS